MTDAATPLKKIPLWNPKNPEKSQMGQFLRFVEQKTQRSIKNYEALHFWSIEEPAAFWQSLCEFYKLSFDTPAQYILQQGSAFFDSLWFGGAHLNFAEKLIGHLNQEDRPVLISILEDGSRKVFSGKALNHAVAACAVGLKKAGLQVGDRVAALMPNLHYTVIAMLATASLGGIWSSCSPDFGSEALLDRFTQIEPKILFAGNAYFYQGNYYSCIDKINALVEQLPSLEQTVLCPILQAHEVPLPANTLYWEDFINKKEQSPQFLSLPFSQPLYILFSSGTTGKPKCIVHGAGGTYLQHLKELGLHCDLDANDRLFFYTTCGWMMWNWMLSALSLGTTLILYEGSPTFPRKDRLYQLLEAEKVTVFGTSPKFISLSEKTGLQPKSTYDLSALRTILSTGSPLLPEHYDFVYRSIKEDLQLSSISGGTDLLSCFALGNPLVPVYRGELQSLGLGMAVEVFNQDGQSIENEAGELVCTKPFPSMPLYFWKDENKARYRASYFERFPGVWTHGDLAQLTKAHGLIIWGRSDSTLNAGGIRIGTAEIYQQLEKIPEILESVVITQKWQDDSRIVLFVKLDPDLTLDQSLIQRIKTVLKEKASPRHVPKKIIQVSDIPHTRNGKILELAVRQLVHGQALDNLNAIANPECLEEFKQRPELQ